MPTPPISVDCIIWSRRMESSKLERQGGKIDMNIKAVLGWLRYRQQQNVEILYNEKVEEREDKMLK